MYERLHRKPRTLRSTIIIIIISTITIIKLKQLGEKEKDMST